MRKLMLLGLFTVAALTGAARTADAGCASGLGDCYYSAANIESFWYRWAGGIDCELDFIECSRIKIMGS